MKTIIEQVSKSFLDEANASPRMLEDLAAMEKYMSESYDGRTFIELLQNADDAGSNRVRVLELEDAIIVANDGRPFDENDIMAICRSGASNKQRGNNIGYRGVGFKSATTISEEIVIYSSEVYFTFSKSLCARTLGLEIDKVPTIRIPFLFNEKELSCNVLNKIHELSAEGFNTLFIFLKANIKKFFNELREFDSGCLIFLKNVMSVEVFMSGLQFDCSVERERLLDHEKIVTIKGVHKKWYVINENDIALAFLFEDENGLIPCQTGDAVFHCFLPTVDKTGFPFKINADFSTDPSRKHLIKDELTNTAIQKTAKLLASFVANLFERRDEKLYSIINLIGTHVSLSEISMVFEKEVFSELSWRKWVVLGDNNCAIPKNVKILPKWMSENERQKFLENVPDIKKQMISQDLSIYYEKLYDILKRIGVNEIESRYFKGFLSDKITVGKLGNVLAAKILVYEGRRYFSDLEWLGEIYVPTELGLVNVKNCNNKTIICEEYRKILQQLLTVKEWQTLISAYSVFGTAKIQRIKEKSSNKKLRQINNSKKAQMAINKWKSPVQNCLAAESMMGLSAKDVSKMCNEYSVISVDAAGNTKYILVIPVQHLGDTIKLSEAQYSAAQRLGEDYELFIIATEASDSEYTYIKNPYEKIKLNRVVKEWEWICEEYNSAEKVKSAEAVNVIDDSILKNISASYFNRQQRAYLKELIVSDTELAFDNSKKILIEQINSITDFYTGENMVEICDNTILISEDKKNALKKILELY